MTYNVKSSSWNEAFAYWQDRFLQGDVAASIAGVIEHQNLHGSRVDGDIQGPHLENASPEVIQALRRHPLWTRATGAYVLDGEKLLVALADRDYRIIHFNGYLFRFAAMYRMFLKWAADRKSKSRVAVFFNIDDQGDSRCISMCAPNETSSLLIPDYEYISSEGYAGLINEIDAAYVPFEQRQDKAFWRGVGSGCIWNKLPQGAALADTFTRAWLSQQTLVYPNHFDCRLTDISPSAHLLDPIARQAFNSVMGSPCGQLDFMNYKLSVDVDGWASAFKGLFSKLAMGCVVLKIDSALGYRQWYYDRLSPYVHYIPVERNEKSLVDAVDWVFANPSVARDISERARELARQISYSEELTRASSVIETAAISF